MSARFPLYGISSLLSGSRITGDDLDSRTGIFLLSEQWLRNEDDEAEQMRIWS